MRRRALALGAALLLGCNFVGDNEPPAGVTGNYVGLLRSEDQAWTSSVTAGLIEDGLAVTGSVAVTGRACSQSFDLRGSLDARYFQATLVSRSSTLSWNADTLLNRIVGTFVAVPSAPCTGGRGTIDLIRLQE
ncbi:MAG: hypothetical protein U1E65_03170 [Myxococcota bacterium]